MPGRYGLRITIEGRSFGLGRIDLFFRHAGALRGRRPLRGGYTGFAYCLPMVGTKILFCDQREHPPEGDIHVTK